MQRMVLEGIPIRDEEVVDLIKKEAKEMLENDPEKWTDEMIRTKLYFITDALDDFVGCNNRAEELGAPFTRDLQWACSFYQTTINTELTRKPLMVSDLWF
ncbi:hypothetical protein [uncultured Brevibacillus sp.]|uniref:hypothetical protein n=1 Tax=uncultured Brevibacillus sp. TaxID=169970 RepID=UPI002598B299|nr:hypothetical protein [uncultured Brevibacillus sp.]